jgi:hypothetical protein
MTLVRVVTRTDRREASPQLHGKRWVALEIHAAWAALKIDQRKHPAADLEHRDSIPKRVVLNRSR